jgi:hypothetical protein
MDIFCVFRGSAALSREAPTPMDVPEADVSSINASITIVSASWYEALYELIDFCWQPAPKIFDTTGSEIT